MKKLAEALFLILIILLSAAGCAFHVELKDLSIVEGVGIDKNPNGGYLITFQVYQPSSSGESGSGKQATGRATKCIQATGVSIFDASRNATKEMGKKLYYSSNRSLLLGREVCGEGIGPIIDFFERNHEIGPAQKIFMTEGKAADLLTRKSDDGAFSAEKMAQVLQNNYNTSMVYDMTIGKLQNIEESNQKDFMLPVLSVKEKTSGASSSSGGASSSGSDSESGVPATVIIEKTAVFNDEKFVGTIGPAATRGAIWMLGEIEDGVINVEREGLPVSLEIRSVDSKTSVSDENGKPVFKVSVKLRTRIVEDETHLGDIDEETLDSLIELQNREVREEIQMAVNTILKQYKSDPIGLGQMIYQKIPSLWRTVSEDWDNMLSDLQVLIDVTSTIEDTGLDL